MEFILIVYCSECEFWVRHKIPEWGQCRRNAPSPIKSISDNFIGPYNHRVVWLYTRNTDFCGQGIKGKIVVIPEVSKDQEVKLDTLPKIKSFDTQVREAMNTSEDKNE